MSSEPTLEISITLRKTRVQLVQISLRCVMHPLLFRKRPPFVVKNAGLQADDQRLVLRQRQDSGNLSSYEEIWSAQLVVRAHVCASRVDRGHQRRPKKLATPWSGSVRGIGSGTRGRGISGPNGCSTTHHVDGNGSYDGSCQENESRGRAGPPRSGENQEHC